MKKLLFIMLGVLSCITNIYALVVKNPVDYVNPLVGTASKRTINGQHLSRYSITMGYELLDSTNRKDGGRLDLRLRSRQDTWY